MEEHAVSDILGAPSKNRVSLPALDGLLQLTKAIWSSLASCQPISEKADELYQL